MFEDILDRSKQRSEFEYFVKFKKMTENFDQLWSMKSLSRENIRNWLKNNNIEYNICDNVANACSELIENTIKYGKINEEIFVLINIVEKKIIIETLNKSTIQQKESFTKYLENLSRELPDLTDLYLKRIQNSVITGISQLGLVKIMLETGGKIELLDKNLDEVVHLKVTIGEKDIHMYKLLSGQLDVAFEHMQYYEQKTTHLEKRLKMVLSNSPVILLAFDKKGIITLAEGNDLTFLGLGQTNIVGDSIINLFQNKSPFISDIRRSLRGENFISVIELEELVLEIRWSPVIDYNNEVSEVIIIATNVTERKNAEDSYRRIFENALEGIFQSTPHGRFINANPAMARILGYDSAEELIDSIKEIGQQLFFSPKKLDDLVYFFTNIEDKLKNFECKLYKKDKKIIWVSMNIRAMRDNQGNVIYLEGLVEDITKRKKAESKLLKAHDDLEHRVNERTEQLARAKEAAETANKAKSEFLANMSHELRTPLNSVLGYAQILKRDKNLTKSQQNGLNMIQISGEHLLTLITDILDLSKIEAGRMELYPIQFHFPIFIKSIVGMMKMRADQKNIVFSYETSSLLPTIVKADEKRLRQVLINLLSNAVKFTHSGKISFRVNLIEEQEYEDEDNDNEESHLMKLRLEVEDSGIGISQEQINKIFIPFEQVSDIRCRSEGLGLGLSISQKLLHEMQSVLNVKSELNQGSLFWFDLELPASREEIHKEDIIQRNIIGYKGEGKKILIVDDKSLNRKMLVGLLSLMGFTEIEEAENGKEGMAKAKEIMPDLIFMDLIMPIVTGIEATLELRKLPEFKDITIIGVSASVFDKFKHNGMLAGCDAFLSKPIEEEKLTGILETHLNLDWIYEEQDKNNTSNQEINKSSETSLLTLHQEEITNLLELARVGDILAIQEQSEKLKDKNKELIPFANKLQKLAEGFQVEKTLEFIEDYMNQIKIND